MFSIAALAIDDVSLPEDGREVLWCTSDGRHRVCILLLIVQIVDVVLTFAEVNELELVIGQQEQVRRFDISMTDSPVLQESTG